ncbi:MAG: hypothetical protein IJ424_03725 [Oscillospiraceae bacterium]|nr:hypothetical protein [Oscillospiraceae bacterium]
MRKLSFNIALGGIISALCILMMFLVSVLPFFVYVFPMLCSFLICIVYYESGLKISLITYLSVAILSLILSPDKESALIFTAFFGYYPMAKIFLDKMRYSILRRVIKFALFNASVIASYYALINIFGVVDMAEIGEGFGKYSVLILLVVANISFIAYDFAIGVLSVRYLAGWRKLLFKGIKTQ